MKDQARFDGTDPSLQRICWSPGRSLQPPKAGLDGHTQLELRPLDQIIGEQINPALERSRIRLERSRIRLEEGAGCQRAC